MQPAGTAGSGSGGSSEAGGSEAGSSSSAVCVEYRLPSGATLEVWAAPSAIDETGFILAEVFHHHEYLRHGISLRPGDVVVDVGACTGLFGCHVLSLPAPCGSAGDVTYLGVEPAPASYALARANLLGPAGDGTDSFFHMNQACGAPLLRSQRGGGGSRTSAPYPANIRLVCAALSSRAGERTLTWFPRAPGNSTLRPTEKAALQAAIMPARWFAGAEELAVPVTTLPALLEQQGISGQIALLKVDVEGEELEVLRGLDEPTWRRVRQVAAEVHDVLPGQFEDAPAAAGAPVAGPAPQLLAAAPAAPQLPGARGPVPPGPRTGCGIDGQHIRYVPRPWPGPAAAGDAAGGETIPPPLDGARTMAVARLLRDRGFTVTIECSFGRAVNYSVTGVRAGVPQPAVSCG